MSTLSIEELIKMQEDTESLRGIVDKDFEENVSLEFLGFSDMAKGVIEFFSKSLSALSNAFGESTNYTKKVEVLPHFEKFKHAFSVADKVANRGGDFYSKVEDLKVPYIVGCKMTLDEVTRQTNALLIDHNTIIMDCINAADRIVSDKLHDKNYLSGGRVPEAPKPIVEARMFAGKVKVFNNEMISDKYNRNDMATLGDIIPNLKSITIIKENLLEMKGILDADLITKINNRASALHAKIKVMLENNTSKKDDKTSKEGLQYLSGILLVTAEAITALATLYYIATQCVTSFRAIVETLEDVK